MALRRLRDRAGYRVLESAYNHSLDRTDTNHPWYAFQPPGPNGSPGQYPAFNAIHMSVIPKGPRRGHIIMWDWHHYAAVPSTYQQRWSILDPVSKAFSDALLVTGVAGDPMCAGHAWDADGNLLVAGGNQYTLVGGNLRIWGHNQVWQ